MPKVTGRRIDRAKQLALILEKGPAFSHNPGTLITPVQAKNQCMIWLASWVTPEVHYLVPELRSLLEENNHGTSGT